VSYEAEELSPRKKNKISRVLMLAVLLALVALGALFYLTRTDTSLPIFQKIYDGVASLVGGNGEQQISVIFMRGSEYRLDGKKVFVIQGNVTNKSNKTRKYVKINGTLFDRDGKPVARSAGYCGYTMGPEAIKRSTYEALRKAFEYIPYAKAPPFPPERNLPFTVIFFDPPPNAMEFSVDIADAPPLV
jgi:hypothetical protein